MKGKSALVTGSSNGLGLAMANALARAGCNVVLHGLDTPASMTQTVHGLKREFGVDVDYRQEDLADPEGAGRLVDAARERMGSVDILINNAVVRHFASIVDFPVARWHEALAVNLSAAFLAIQRVLPGMRASGWGRIFNMTSVYGSRAVANRVDYVTTKTALLGLTRSVAMEALEYGVTCNAICPGSVLTPNIDGRINALMNAQGLDREEAVRIFLAGKQPTGKLVEASHVADLVVFLCGPAGDQITGAMMPIEGGWLAS